MKICPGTSKAHKDAAKIVEYLQGHGGSTEGTNDEIARDIGFFTNPGQGVFHVNKGRFHGARNHLMDHVDQDGKPCCAGYRVNYRKAGRGQSQLKLLEQGENDLDIAALEELKGVTSRLHQHQTEINRMDKQIEALRIWCWAERDQSGYDVLAKVQEHLLISGTIPPSILIEFASWASSRSES